MNSPTQGPAFGVEAGRKLPFSEPLEKADQAPVCLRANLEEWLERHTPVCPMIYTPEFKTTSLFCPASIFAVSSGHWLWLAEDSVGIVKTSSSSHAATRSVELSQVLLQGSLQILAVSAKARIFFNMVGMELFFSAVQSVLDAAEAASPVAGVEPSQEELAKLPFKLRSALQEFIPAKHPLRRLASWPEGNESGKFIPAGLIALTDRHLCLLREGLPSLEEPPGRDLSCYGKQVLYLSRSSPLTWASEQRDGIANLVISSGGAPTADLVLPETALAEVGSILSACGF